METEKKKEEKKIPPRDRDNVGGYDSDTESSSDGTS